MLLTKYYQILTDTLNVSKHCKILSNTIGVTNLPIQAQDKKDEKDQSNDPCEKCSRVCSCNSCWGQDTLILVRFIFIEMFYGVLLLQLLRAWYIKQDNDDIHPYLVNIQLRDGRSHTVTDRMLITFTHVLLKPCCEKSRCILTLTITLVMWCIVVINVCVLTLTFKSIFCCCPPCCHQVSWCIIKLSVASFIEV